jgi:predicted metal-dependent phosphoesterase TrpH
MAADIGLQAISITDHDTLDGSRNALAGKLPAGLHFVTGVEISVAPPDDFHLGGSLHMLAYGIDLNNAPLQQALDELQQARNERVHRIIERLDRLGIGISIEQVAARVNEGGVPGRPHIAAALVEAGAARDIDDAFDRYLKKSRPAYVDKYRLDCQRSFDLIRSASGVPVLAHPYLIQFNPEQDLEKLVSRLCGMGLMGLEAYYPQHPARETAQYIQLAEKYGLVITGGTDFHGELSPDIQLGRGYGNFNIPFEIYQNLSRRIAIK